VLAAAWYVRFAVADIRISNKIQCTMARSDGTWGPARESHKSHGHTASLLLRRRLLAGSARNPHGFRRAFGVLLAAVWPLVCSLWSLDLP